MHSNVLHLVNCLECLRSREEPVANIEAGRRTNTDGILANIATHPDRPLNRISNEERFVDDAEAETYLHREYRECYSL